MEIEVSGEIQTVVFRQNRPLAEGNKGSVQ